MTEIKSYTLTELTVGLDATIRGERDCLISGVSPIQQAQPGHITFLTNSRYRKYLPATRAAAVILSEADAGECPVNTVICHNPYYIYARIAAFFEMKPALSDGIHPTAVIGEHGQIHPTARIGAHCVIGARVRIGPKVVLGPGCRIGDDTTIAEQTRLDAGVTIYHSVNIGRRVRLSSGVVIGSDGFGFANEKGAWHKVPQLGGVDIGDDVDIGANTTIDRGAVENTVIEEGVKLDNLIQVGHNVRIGAHTIIAACVGISGSAVIGRHCMIGGAALIGGHLTIADHVVLTGLTTVTRSIREPGMYSSGIIGAVPNQEFLKNNARFYRLENLMQRVKNLEAALNKMTERKK